MRADPPEGLTAVRGPATIAVVKAPLVTRAQVRELDRCAIEDHGIPSMVLMENAGRACAFQALRMLAEADNDVPVVVVCGAGNNGGDGFVIARTLENHGRAARVFFAASEAKLSEGSDDLRTNAELWTRSGGTITTLDSDQGRTELQRALEGAPLLIDALFGTGLSKELRTEARELIEMLRDSKVRTLAVDLPSGLDADTGEVLGSALPAEVTITFAACKVGLTYAMGPELAGQVYVAEIGIPRVLLEALEDETT